MHCQRNNMGLLEEVNNWGAVSNPNGKTLQWLYLLCQTKYKNDFFNRL